MNIRLIKQNDMTRMPWKNGGGETLEVAIHPSTATLDQLDFEWRVSIASIESDGPFSTFPGYTRHLVIWKGDGLLINGVAKTAMQPFEFDGSDKITAKLIRDTVKDFGVIAKSKAFTTTLTMHSLAEEATSQAEVNGDSFILCTRGELRIDGFYLNHGDAVHATGTGNVEIKALDRSDYAIATISASVVSTANR